MVIMFHTIRKVIGIQFDNKYVKSNKPFTMKFVNIVSNKIEEVSSTRLLPFNDNFHDLSESQMHMEYPLR